MDDIPYVEYTDGFEQWLDPFSEYERLRGLGPVARVKMPNGLEVWHVFGHHDGQALLMDQRLSKDFHRMQEVFEETGRTAQEAGFVLSGAAAGNLLNSDPPEHTRLRRLVNRTFTPKQVATIQAATEATARELVEPAVSRGSFDLIDDYAYPLTIRVICQLLGIPSTDQDRFREWALAATSPRPTPSGMTRDEGVAHLLGYLRSVIEDRRPSVSGAPEDQSDVIAGMIAAEEAGGLTDDEILSMAFLLLIAGHETTVGMIGMSTLNLLQAPDQLDLLRGSPDLMPAAVEECLRFSGSVQRTTFRVTTVDIEISGVQIPKGSVVTVVLGAANRDGAIADCPHEFDVTRQRVPHIAFGYGAHFCLGAALARMEIGVALRVLLDECAHLELERPIEELEWTLGPIRSPLHVPLRVVPVDTSR
jgi:cytochrome P450